MLNKFKDLQIFKQLYQYIGHLDCCIAYLVNRSCQINLERKYYFY